MICVKIVNIIEMIKIYYFFIVYIYRLITNFKIVLSKNDIN